MTKTEIALSAIRGLPLTATTHLDINTVMRTLGLDTVEASDLRKAVGREWRTADHDSDLGEVLSIAKDVANQYARNYAVR
jgi:hypothetical protein